MKTLILLLLLSVTAAAAAAQSPQRLAPHATIHRWHFQAARPPAFRQPIQQRTVVVPAFRRPIIVHRGGSCGIGRWVDGVFTCQAGPVERALDRLNYTIERSYSEQSAIQAIQADQEQRALAQIEAANKAASDAAYIRSTNVFAPPAGLGPIPDEKIYKRVGPNGIVTYSNVQ